MSGGDALEENVFIHEMEEHLRGLSRQLMRLDTTDAILKHLSKLIMDTMNADVVFIMNKNENRLELHSSIGMKNPPLKIVPINLTTISPQILNHSTRGDNEVYQDTLFELYIEKFGIQDWFSIPIRDEDSLYGLCFVGYYEPTKLYGQLKEAFDELGNYVAMSINLIRKGEQRAERLLTFQADNLQGTDLDRLVEEVVYHIGKETHCKKVGIYLFNQDKSNLVLQRPTYQGVSLKAKIVTTASNFIKDVLPRVEEVGYFRITIPIHLDMEMIGVIFAQKDYDDFFNHDDYDLLTMYSNYFATIYENHQLIHNEQQRQMDLEMLLRIQQKLIKGTVDTNDIRSTNQMVGRLINGMVLLFDQYMNLVDDYIPKGRHLSKDKIRQAGQEIRNQVNLNRKAFTMTVNDRHVFQVNAIDDGIDHYGFLAIEKAVFYQNDLDKVAWNMLNNIYSVQFIKKQIEWSSKEEVKESFIQKLLSTNIESMTPILEFAAMHQWDISKPHYVVVIATSSAVNDFENLMTLCSQYITLQKALANHYRSIVSSRIDNKLVCFVPQNLVKGDFWSDFQDYINQHMDQAVYIGIGGLTDQSDSYYRHYQRALQTIMVLDQSSDFEQKNMAHFDDLGSYTLLKELENLPIARMFVNTYLRNIYLQSQNQTINYYETLKSYVFNGGQIQETANELFLHRSTLTYRLDKVRELVHTDIDNSKERFNYILAYKLVDLMGYEVFEQN